MYPTRLCVTLYYFLFVVRLPGSISSANMSNPQQKPAGSMKISDQTIEEVDEQLTITSMRGNEPRPTAQSLFIPHASSKPVDVPAASYMPRDYVRTHSEMPPTSNSFIFPMNNADMEFFTSTSAPTTTTSTHHVDVPNTQSSPNEDFDFNYKDDENNDEDDEDEFEKLRLAREKERLERQKQKLARSISTQQNQNP